MEVLVEWYARVFKGGYLPKAKRLTLVFVDYSTADHLLKLNKGWRIAKEEDKNKRLDKVYLEKTEPL